MKTLNEFVNNNYVSLEGINESLLKLISVVLSAAKIL